MRRAVAFTAVVALTVAACGSDGDGDLEAFCGATEKIAAFEEPSADDPEAIAEARDVIESLADNAPSEIGDATQTASQAFGEFLDAIETIDPTDERAFEEVIEPLFNDPDVSAASDRLSEFALDECGVDLD